MVRRLLQRRLITGRRGCPATLTRQVRCFTDANGTDRLEVSDEIRLPDDRLQVRRAAFGTDFQTAYIAASGVYQDAVLQPWTDLTSELYDLNRDRTLRIRRIF